MSRSAATERDRAPLSDQDVLLEAAALVRRFTKDPDSDLAESLTCIAFGERPDDVEPTPVAPDLADVRVQKLARDLYAIAHQCSVDDLCPDDSPEVDAMAVRLWQAFDALRDSLASAFARTSASPAPTGPEPVTCKHGKTHPHRIDMGRIQTPFDCPGPERCSTCNEPMDSPGCSKSPDDNRPRALAGFHTLAGPGPATPTEPTKEQA